MQTLYHISVWLHILAAAAWVGGMAFLAAVIVPTLRRPEMRMQAVDLIHATGTRFRTLGWAALLTLLATGVYNLDYRGYDWAHLFSGELFEGAFGTTLQHKLELVTLIFGLSLVHDFFIGPRATEVWKSAPQSAAAQKYRKTASYMGRLNMLLALVVVYMAVRLVRGG